MEIVDIATSPKLETYARHLWEKRNRKGMTPKKALDEVKTTHVFGCMMVREGEADGVVCGLNRSYPETIRPALQVVGLAPGVSRVRTYWTWDAGRQRALVKVYVGDDASAATSAPPAVADSACTATTPGTESADSSSLV